MEFDSRIKEALIKMNFVNRYEDLAKKFDDVRTPLNERLEYLDGEEVMETIRNLGYVPQFDSKEKFFKTKDETIGNYLCRVHIILRYDMVELVWVVQDGNEILLGYPWSIYSRILVDSSYRIECPVFGTYEDLDEILKITFEMYEDFKKALLNG